MLIPTNARSFVTHDEAQARRADDTSKLLVREAAKQGYGEYRAHLDFMDLVADQYGSPRTATDRKLTLT